MIQSSDKRADFPLLQHHPNLIYLDNASTSQKPQQVLAAMNNFYMHEYANVHRGVYALAERATTLYEEARAAVAQFIGAKPNTLVFTRGTTESINMVAWSWAYHTLNPGDEIIIPQSEHHANMLPWQQLEQVRGVKLVYAPVLPDGTLDYDVFASLATKKTKLISVSHVSHVTGAQHDIPRLVAYARAVGAHVLLDAAQSAPHQPIDVAQLDVDFCAFSAHKMLGPTGIGALYIKETLHDACKPYQTGGGMVYSVDWHTAQFLPIPHRLEAGTPPIAQAIGFAAACRYLQQVDMAWLKKHEAHLCALFIDGLATIKGSRIIGSVDQLRSHGHLVTFTLPGLHAHDIAAYLSNHSVCVRAGHHCAQPFARHMGLDASVRASFYLYSTVEEVTQCVEVIDHLCKSA